MPPSECPQAVKKPPSSGHSFWDPDLLSCVKCAQKDAQPVPPTYIWHNRSSVTSRGHVSNGGSTLRSNANGASMPRQRGNMSITLSAQGLNAHNLINSTGDSMLGKRTGSNCNFSRGGAETDAIMQPDKWLERTCRVERSGVLKDGNLDLLQDTDKAITIAVPITEPSPTPSRLKQGSRDLNCMVNII